METWGGGDFVIYLQVINKTNISGCQTKTSNMNQAFQNKDPVTGEFVEWYLDRGFGTMNKNDFLYLLQQVYLDDWREIVKKAKRDTNESTQLPKTFAEALGDTGKGFCKKLLEKLVSDAAEGFADSIKAIYKEYNK